MELLTAAQMRAVEAAAMASRSVTGLDLMKRAGRGVVDAVLAEWPELAAGKRRALVLCGPGNNGGDGFVAASTLQARGWSVEVFLYGDTSAQGEDARAARALWDGPVVPLEEAMAAGMFGHYKDASARVDVVVDALFGTGLTRALDQQALLPLLAGLHVHISELRDAGAPEHAPWIVAVDIPSGLCADSGRVLVPPGDGMAMAVVAHLTVVFHKLKRGHLLGDGPAHCGAVRVVEIGLPQGADPRWVGPEAARSSVRTIGRADAERTRHKASGGHKFNNGSALVLSGGIGRGGAARLAARGALRVGAGLVTVGCPPAALSENAARLDAVMLRSVKDGDVLAALLDDRRITALCLGPGLGTGAREAGLVRAALSADGEDPGPRGGSAGRHGREVVLDADALTLLAQDADLRGMLHGRCVLTPHGGEFARLWPDIAAKLAAPAVRGPAYSKVDATREAAARAGCVVLFKGADTVIADPEGRCSINSAGYERAAPWLATAGSGDVLAGIVTGLMARGLAPMQAAETGAWLHVECARRFGPGLIAEDLPEQLPQVFRDLGGGEV